MSSSPIIRPISASDYAGWRPLWDGYNAFYGRSGDTALPEAITRQSWERFLDADIPVHALAAERHGEIIGIAHTVIHLSTTRLADVCYLQDLYTAPQARGQGVARALIAAVYRQAEAAGCGRVYWQTHHSNETARALYDTVADHKGFIVYGRDLPA